VLKHPLAPFILPSVVPTPLSCERLHSASPSEKLRRPLGGGVCPVRFLLMHWFEWNQLAIRAS
jgi:hypothetical protein